MSSRERVETIIIGAGQAGLATGYHLAKRGRPFLILERTPRIGDVWRDRYDSLRLYSPAKFDRLPGWDNPLPAWSYPGKEDMASYLEAYADRCDIPVRTGVRVDGVARLRDGYVISSGDQTFEADNVVVAAGGWQLPRTPDFAADLDPAIRQLHSNDYRNPSQLQDGSVLVVGCSHSGADIALELAPSHHVVLSGPVRGEIPFDIEGKVARFALPLLWFMANHVLTERTPVGRKMRQHVRHEGGPLLRVKRAHLAAAGVERVELKTVSVVDGKPALEDGRVLDVQNVVWCTGFGLDTSWIDADLELEDGWPAQHQGAVNGQDGLYFVGLPFQYAFASMLIGGVGRDAEQVAGQVARRKPSGTPRKSASRRVTPVG